MAATIPAGEIPTVEVAAEAWIWTDLRKLAAAANAGRIRRSAPADSYSAGRVPAVLYGRELDTMHLSVDAREAEHLFRSIDYSLLLIFMGTFVVVERPLPPAKTCRYTSSPRTSTASSG